MSGRKVIVGIRPQNIGYVEHQVSKRCSDTTMTVEVELIESRGDRSCVVARGAKDATLRFLITRDIDILPGDKVQVCVDGRRIHLFDPQTNLNIFNA
jgi:ABC-type sugar transport system ATPase subunit